MFFLSGSNRIIRCEKRKNTHTHRLARRAYIGDDYLYLQDEVDWEVGQQIVLITTAMRDSRDWHQNEIFTIVAIATASTTSLPFPEIKTRITLSSPIVYEHIARPEYQGEVALLTRTIKIQGSSSDSEPTDASAPGATCGIVKTDGSAVKSFKLYDYLQYTCPDKDLTGYGGHIIVRDGGKGYVEGVELYRMGQTNVLGRYPMHFHVLANGCQDCYLRDSSIHRSFYRCVSIHGTNGLEVSENVGFDVIGYCYYMEDGVEEDNTISYNLGAHIHVLGFPAIGSGQKVGIVKKSNVLDLPADITASA